MSVSVYHRKAIRIPVNQMVRTVPRTVQNTDCHKRVLSLPIELKVLQSKRANAKSFTTVRKLWPFHSSFRKTHTYLARIICRYFIPNFIKIDQGLRNVKVQIPLALPQQSMTVATPIFTKLAIDSFL
jgi:hypothetical protein